MKIARLAHPTVPNIRDRGPNCKPMIAMPVMIIAEIAETAWAGDTCARSGPGR